MICFVNISVRFLNNTCCKNIQPPNYTCDWRYIQRTIELTFFAYYVIKYFDKFSYIIININSVAKQCKLILELQRAEVCLSADMKKSTFTEAVGPITLILSLSSELQLCEFCKQMNFNAIKNAKQPSTKLFHICLGLCSHVFHEIYYYISTYRLLAYSDRRRPMI